jgi:hypothetical protein
VTIPAYEPCASLLDKGKHAVAIELDFMKPLIA